MSFFLYSLFLFQLNFFQIYISLSVLKSFKPNTLYILIIQIWKRVYQKSQIIFFEISDIYLSLLLHVRMCFSLLRNNKRLCMQYDYSSLNICIYDTRNWYMLCLIYSLRYNLLFNFFCWLSIATVVYCNHIICIGCGYWCPLNFCSFINIFYFSYMVAIFYWVML